MAQKVPGPKAKTQGRKRSRQTNGGIQDLLEAIRAAKDAHHGIELLPGCELEGGEREGIAKLIRFGKRHAQMIIDGEKPDQQRFQKTVNLANNVADDLSGHFDEFVAGSLVEFQNRLADLRKAAPDVILIEEDKIITLLDDLRKLQADDVATYDAVAAAFIALKNHLDTLEKRAGEAVKAAREAREEEKRSERRKAGARDVLAELEAFEFEV